MKEQRKNIDQATEGTIFTRLLDSHKAVTAKRIGLGLFDNIITEVLLASLHEHLRIAMTLELSTIPPYLCAFYSIQTGDSTKENYKEEFGDNAEVAQIIRSVMMEEMLHLTLAGNILNAVGGVPMVNQEQYVPTYPTKLPHSDGHFWVNLRKFDKEAIHSFMQIEQPTPPHAAPTVEGYATIGQFYEGIIQLLELLEKRTNIFTGDPKLQIDQQYYYGAGNEEIIPVTDLKSAKEAIEIIMEQGEGSQTSIYDVHEEVPEGHVKDLAHYFKFNEIYLERRYTLDQNDPNEPPKGDSIHIKYDKVYPMGTDLKTINYAHAPELAALSNEFNLHYRYLLDDLQAAFTGQQDRLIQGVGRMYELRNLALALMRNPIPGREVNAGPTFEYLPDLKLP